MSNITFTKWLLSFYHHWQREVSRFNFQNSSLYLFYGSHNTHIMQKILETFITFKGKVHIMGEFSLFNQNLNLKQEDRHLSPLYVFSRSPNTREQFPRSTEVRRIYSHLKPSKIHPKNSDVLQLHVVTVHIHHQGIETLSLWAKIPRN